MEVHATVPVYDADLFADAAILDPVPHYAAMRALGPVVRLPSADCYAITTYDACREVLHSPDRFVSGRGVALNPALNRGSPSVIASDGEHHAFMRRIEAEPLGPKAVAAIRGRITDEAERLIDGLLARGDAWVDGARDIACYLPLTVVMELGGLPPAGRSEMLRWAAATFDLLGPANARATAALPVVQEFIAYVARDIDGAATTPGSWAARAFDLAREGVIPPELVPTVLSDFIAPSLDTTIAGTSNLLMLLGRHRDQWDYLKANPARVPQAINESLRLGSPIRCFSRFVPAATELAGVRLPAEARVAVFYASGNRDEARFPDPDRFDITRANSADQIAFGTGAHQCPGHGLARMEMIAIVSTMLKRIDHFEIGTPVYAENNLLRTLASLPMRLHSAAA